MLTFQGSHLHYHHGHHMALTVYHLQTDKKNNTNVSTELPTLIYDRKFLISIRIVDYKLVKCPSLTIYNSLLVLPSVYRE